MFEGSLEITETSIILNGEKVASIDWGSTPSSLQADAQALCVSVIVDDSGVPHVSFDGGVYVEID